MRSRVALALSTGLALAVAAYGAFGPGGLSRLHELEREAAVLDDEINTLTHQNARIAEQARLLAGNDPLSRSVQEKVVREELGYIRPDEIVLLPPPRADHAAPAWIDEPTPARPPPR